MTKVQISADLADLVPGYLLKRKSELTIFREYVEKKDFTNIEKAAHKIKGSALGYGFALLSEYARELEDAARKQSQPECDRLINLIAHYLEELEITFE